MIRRGAVAVVVAVGVGVAGCGGSSRGSAQPAAAAAATAAAAGGSTVASAPTPAAANRSGQQAPASKPRRHHAAARPLKVVSGTGGVIVPAAHITLASAAPLVRTSFVSEADAVCRDYRGEVAGKGGASTLPAQEKVYATVVDDATHALVRLQQLSPPAAQRRLFLRYLALTGAAVDDFAAAQGRSRSTSAATGNKVEARDLRTFALLARRVTAARAVARQLGLRVCGSAGSDWL
jgi:hypothetical protein